MKKLYEAFFVAADAADAVAIAAAATASLVHLNRGGFFLGPRIIFSACLSCMAGARARQWMAVSSFIVLMSGDQNTRL